MIVLIIIAALAAVLGAYLRWAVVPVISAYRIGVELGGMLEARLQDPGPPAPWRRRAVQAAGAWLAPWRAAREIREQRENIRLMVRVLADVLDVESRSARREPDVLAAS